MVSPHHTQRETTMANMPTETPVGGRMNGYEIRLKLLELAQTQAMQPAMARIHGKENWEADQVTFPTEDEVLAIAEKFYTFVNNNQK